MDAKILWWTLDYQLGIMLTMINQTDYPTLYSKIASAKGDINALLIAEIGGNNN